jgi:hypothetical protein
MLLIVCVVGFACGLAGWLARDWSQSDPRLPEHQVAGTVSSIDATGLCVKPDDISADSTCASTVAISPDRVDIPIGTRVRGSYSVFPSDKGAGVFMWVTLAPTS